MKLHETKTTCLSNYKYIMHRPTKHTMQGQVQLQCGLESPTRYLTTCRQQLRMRGSSWRCNCPHNATNDKNNSIIVHEHINICGAVRLCTTFAKLSQLLGKCWHLPAASAWLEALIWHTIRRPPEPTTIDKYSSLDEVHKCNSTCKHVEYTKN